MAFQLTVLGSGSARPVAGRFPSSHALVRGRSIYLIDCGEGAQIQMNRYGLPIERVAAVFLTHLHADHVLGLFGLLASLSMTNRQHPLPVYAHPAFLPVLEMNFNFFVARQDFPIQFHSFDDEASTRIFEDEGMTVRTIPLDHRVPTCGFLFREKPGPLNIRKEVVSRYGLGPDQIAQLKSRASVRLPDGTVLTPTETLYQKSPGASYAYISDTRFLPGIAPQLRGVSLLYHEATYLQDRAELATETGHSTARQAAEIALLAQAQQLVIGHYSARYTDLEPLLQEARELFQNAYLAHEGDRYIIE